jgi:hypothetical protein
MVRKTVAVAFFALACTGCFRSTTLVTVRPDGSGTIKQEMGMKAETLAMLKGFAGAGGAQGKDVSANPFTEQQARETGEKMGVRFVSGEPFKTAEFEGYRAQYAFDDITKLKLGMDEQADQMAGAAGGSSSNTTRAPLAFEFTRGASASTLTIRMPDQTPNTPLSGLPQANDMKQNEQALAMAKTMMAGLFIDISLGVEGRIIKANAPTEDNRITLLQMDLDKVMQDPAALEKLQQAKSLMGLQGVPGLKVVSTPTLTVEFGK